MKGVKTFALERLHEAIWGLAGPYVDGLSGTQFVNLLEQLCCHFLVRHPSTGRLRAVERSPIPPSFYPPPMSSMNDDEFHALMARSRRSIETMTEMTRQTRDLLKEAARRRDLLTEADAQLREAQLQSRERPAEVEVEPGRGQVR
ncbi:hypothetical protein BGE01nite_56020 [Brevifollis gellanilyticus]|uniref:Uncharacterized protein n=2 Tax=Brevifollis gellanilyticus TaxID=748831 RepID=A0A512MJ50_9BACT|nr:hypothetical protein BGE01nite_56020 [Brevifollis gellanilyticus]